MTRLEAQVRQALGDQAEAHAELIAEVGRVERNCDRLQDLVQDMPCDLSDLCPDYEWGDE